MSALEDACPRCGRASLHCQWDEEESNPMLFVFRVVCMSCGRVTAHRHGGGLIADEVMEERWDSRSHC